MIKTLVVAIAALYLSFAFAMYFLQGRLTYHPEPERIAPAVQGLADVAERVIETADGEKVIAWYGKAQPGQPTLLYFHGNGGSLASRSERIRKYMAKGRGMFMLSYRGFSGSTGTPSEKANVADAKLAYDAVLKEGVATADIIIYGESIGSGVAVQVAAEKKASGLILDAPYTSVVEIASQRYPWLPVRLLLRDRYESNRYIASVKMPLLIVHGDHDEVIPVEMGKALFALANEPKQIAVLKGAGHADHYMFGSYDAIHAWIDGLRSKPPS